jgi:hypothetical protein
MVAVVLLSAAKDEAKGGLEDVEMACAEEVVDVLERVVELAICAILDEEAGEAEDAEHEALCEGRKVVDLDLCEFIVAADGFEDEVETVEDGGPVEEVASWPAPLGDAVEDAWQLVVCGFVDAFLQSKHLGCLCRWIKIRNGSACVEVRNDERRQDLQRQRDAWASL